MVPNGFTLIVVDVLEPNRAAPGTTARGSGFRHQPGNRHRSLSAIHGFTVCVSSAELEVKSVLPL